MSNPLDQKTSPLQLEAFPDAGEALEAEPCPTAVRPEPFSQPSPAVKHSDDPGKIISIDPRRARVSALNPRNLENLDQENLEELRFVIEAVGQRSPAIARRLVGDPDHDFELLTGARRHRVALDRCSADHMAPLLVQVVTCSDVEAAAIAEAENRGREPNSEYERAVFVRDQLGTLFKGNRKKLCEAFSLTDTRLSRLLSLAKWPPAVIAAFGGARAIRQKDAAALQAILKGEHRDRALDESEVIAAEQAERRREGGAPIGAAEVRRRIIAAVKTHVENLDVIDAATGQLVFTIRSQTLPAFLRDKDAKAGAFIDALDRRAVALPTGRHVGGSPVAALGIGTGLIYAGNIWDKTEARLRRKVHDTRRHPACWRQAALGARPGRLRGSLT